MFRQFLARIDMVVESEVWPWPLDSAARRAKLRRGGKNRAAPLGMTGKKQLRGARGNYSRPAAWGGWVSVRALGRPSARLRFLFRRGGPADAERHGWLIEFALDGIDAAALVEAERLVAEVQAGSLKAKALGDTIAALNVVLGVGEEIDVAARAPESKDGIAVGGRVHVGVVVERNVGIVVADGEANGETSLVIGRADVPGVGSLARQGSVVNPAAVKRGRESHAGLRLAVVRGYAKSFQQPRKKRKMLLQGEFDTLDMSVGTVDGLQEPESRVGLPRRNGAGCRVNRIGQMLVEVSGLDDAQRLEVVLDQDVVIVGFGRLQVGISLSYHAGGWIGIGVNNGGGHEVADIGTGEALAEVGAQVGVLLELILRLDAGQGVEVARALEDSCEDSSICCV